MMEELATALMVIFFIIWSLYVSYCFIRGQCRPQKFVDINGEHKGNGPVLRYLTMMVKPPPFVSGMLYGTRHSFSYLIANAAVLNKRLQLVDIITQVQYGIRVFEISVHLTVPLTGQTTGQVCQQKITKASKPCFTTIPQNKTANTVCAFVAIHPVITDLPVLHALAIIDKTAYLCAIAKLIVVISLSWDKQVAQGIKDDMITPAILTQIKRTHFDHLFIVQPHNLQHLFHTITDAKTPRRFFSPSIQQDETPRNEENAFIAAVIKNRDKKLAEKNTCHLIWLSRFDPFDRRAEVAKTPLSTSSSLLIKESAAGEQSPFSGDILPASNRA